MSQLNSALLLALFFSLYTQEAYPYIDPGVGSYIFQLMVAFLLGGALLLKNSWRNILAYVKKLLSRLKKK